MLWMGGGPSHLDIWDLKPDSEKNGGPFRPIDTSAPGVKISEHLPKVAKQMHHLSILRSLDSKEGNHDRGRYLMHTGLCPQPDGGASRIRLLLSPWSWASGCRISACRIASPSMARASVRGSSGCRTPRSSSRIPNAPIANLKPPKDVEDWRMDRRLAMLGQVENQFVVDAPRPGGPRSQGGLCQDAAHDELAVSGRVQPGPGSRTRCATSTAGARSARAV